MAGEIQVVEDVGLSIYVIVFNILNEIWNTITKKFEAVNAVNWSKYAVPVVDSTGTGIYIGNFPVEITTVGDYPVVSYQAKTPGTPVVGDSPIPGAKEVMHWGGDAEIPVSSMGPQDVVAELYASFVVNTTTFQKIMQGLAAVNLGDLEEDPVHSTSQFTDVNDPGTTRVRSANTGTTRSTLVN